MAKRNDKTDVSDAVSAHGTLDRSEAFERELGVRYQHISSNIDPARARSELAKIKNAGFQDLLARLDDTGVMLGADAVLDKDSARHLPRFGLTLVLPARAPLIWLNLLKHDSITALVDTVVHEAVHSTVVELRRLPRTPEPEEKIASYGEEIVAFTGTNLILRTIRFPAYHEIARNMLAIDTCKEILGRLGCGEKFVRDRLAEAEAAADFFTDLTIAVRPPPWKRYKRILDASSRCRRRRQTEKRPP